MLAPLELIQRELVEHVVAAPIDRDAHAEAVRVAAHDDAVDAVEHVGELRRRVAREDRPALRRREVRDRIRRDRAIHGDRLRSNVGLTPLALALEVVADRDEPVLLRRTLCEDQKVSQVASMA